MASGLINTSRQCGGSIGLAMLVTIANTVTGNRATPGPAAAAAITAGYDRAFLVAGIIIAISAAASALFLRRREAHEVQQRGF